MTGDDEVLLADGFEDALIGIGWQFSRRLAVYDLDRCIEILMGQGLDYEEAVEHFDYNVLGAYVGPNTPVFVSREVDSDAD